MVLANNDGRRGGRKMMKQNSLLATKKAIPTIVIIIIIMTAFTVFQNPSSSLSYTQTQGKSRLEFVHITKTAGLSIEKAASQHGINWGACKFYYFSVNTIP